LKKWKTEGVLKLPIFKDTAVSGRYRHKSFDVMDGKDGTGGGAAGVSSFNGRTGAVAPGDNDYTAAMVGARADDWMPTAADVGAATMTQVNAAIQAAVLDSWEGSY
jgi:hypothetical protein